MAINRPIDHIRFWGLVIMCGSIALALLLPALKIHSVQIHKSIATELESKFSQNPKPTDSLTTTSSVAVPSNEGDPDEFQTSFGGVSQQQIGQQQIGTSTLTTQNQSSNPRIEAGPNIALSESMDNSSILPDSYRRRSNESDQIANSLDPLLLIDQSDTQRPPSNPVDLQIKNGLSDSFVIEEPKTEENNIKTTEIDREPNSDSLGLVENLNDIDVGRLIYANGRVSIYPALAGTFSIGMLMWTGGGLISDFRRRQQRPKRAKRRRR